MSDAGNEAQLIKKIFSVTLRSRHGRIKVTAEVDGQL